jgi:hypothetical protein
LHQLFIDLIKPLICLGEVLYNIPVEFLICSEILSKVCVDKYLYDSVAICDGMKQGHALLLLLYMLLLTALYV